MAAFPPTSPISPPQAIRAWTDAEYFRLLSHELPLEDVKESTRGDKPEDYDPILDFSPTPKAAYPASIGDGECVNHGESRGVSCSSSLCNSTRASCSSTETDSYNCRFRSQEALRANCGAKAEVNDKPIPGVAYEALTDRWIAFWKRRGDTHTACFNCETYGKHRARQMAVQCRQKAEALGLTADEGQPQRPKAAGNEAARALQATSQSRDATPRKDLPSDQAALETQIRQKRVHHTAVPARPDTDRLRGLPKVTGVRFQAQRNRFVAEWYDQGKTRMAYFPVKQYGFEEARRLAIECRERVLLSKHQRLSCGTKVGIVAKRGTDSPPAEPQHNPRLASLPPSAEVPLVSKRQCIIRPAGTKETQPRNGEMHQSASPASQSVSSESQEEGVSTEERLLLAQAALNIILIDLLNKCLPSYCGNGRDRKDARELMELLYEQIQCIHSASEYTQLRPYLSIAESHIASDILPGASSRQAQVRILMDFLEVAAPRG